MALWLDFWGHTMESVPEKMEKQINYWGAKPTKKVISWGYHRGIPWDI
jgi:hypothetical protein